MVLPLLGRKKYKNLYLVTPQLLANALAGNTYAHCHGN